MPHKSSVGWTYSVSAAQVIIKEKVSSTEDADPTTHARKGFEAYVNKSMLEFKVAPELLLGHDEFKEYMFKWMHGEHVLTTKAEREAHKHEPSTRSRVSRVRRVTTVAGPGGKDTSVAKAGAAFRPPGQAGAVAGPGRKGKAEKKKRLESE